MLQVTWTMGMIGWKPIEGYPGWTVGVGWVIALTPLLPIPLFALQQLLGSSGTLRERFVSSSRPSPMWKPARSQHEDPDLSLTASPRLINGAEPADDVFHQYDKCSV
ncbi:hypothetical protein ACOMHN_058147 [Nucella lapillus]